MAHLQNVHTLKFADVYNHNPNNGGWVVGWYDNGHTNQQWTVVPL